MKIKNYSDALAYLDSHIPKSLSQKFPGGEGLLRTKRFLKLLGSPQNKLKVIHIAGTSGKGSTCFMISSLLVAHGFKVGLTLSPHLVDIRERFQIDNKLIPESEVPGYLNRIIPAIDEVNGSGTGKLSYFEILVGLDFLVFADKKVDYAVVETGMGGWYDGTNVVDREDKVSVITRIGLDHTEILGKTVGEIARQKAMIINENSQAVTSPQDPAAEKVIREVAKAKKAELHLVREGIDTPLGMEGEYQSENAAVALKTLEIVGRRDGFPPDEGKIRRAFAAAKFPGRFDTKTISGKTVILDGAHNPQKMEAFIGSLRKKYPNEKFTFLTAFKRGKDFRSMIDIFVPIAERVVITGFIVSNDLIRLAEDPKQIAGDLEKAGFGNYEVIPEPKKALDRALVAGDGKVIVTGSLYLLGEIYKLIN